MKYPILEAATVLSLAVVAASFIYTTPEPGWKTETVAQDTYGKFVEVDSYGSQVGVAYVESIDSGLRLAEKSYSVSPSTLSANSSGSWDVQVVDNRSATGMYADLQSRNGRPLIAYQDGELGDEKLYVAQSEQGGWDTTEVDNVVEGGVGVGMYPSISFLNEDPVVFYHSPSQGLKLAEKNGENWDRQVLEDGQGWYTDTAECGDKVLVAYRGRNTETLKTGEYDGEWSSENTSKTVKSDLEISEENCNTKLFYLDEPSEQMTYSFQNEEREFGYAFYTRLSMETEQNTTHLTYFNEGTGIIYVRKEDGEWMNRTVMNGSEVGNYNDLTIDQLGNIHLAYLDGDTVYHSVYNKGTVQEIKSKTETARKGFVGVAWLLTVLTTWRNDIVPRILSKIRKVRA